MDLLRLVISPAVKMALKLHQDHFAATDDFEEVEPLYNVITDHQTKLFISHEVFLFSNNETASFTARSCVEKSYSV